MGPPFLFAYCKSDRPVGTNVNHTLVKEGWWWWYRKYAPGYTVLEGLEKAARPLDLITELCRTNPVKTRSMWTTVLSDHGDQARSLSCQRHSA
jgi:hypothetical protein